MNTPASFIIKHGILMWYNKNLKIDEIAQRIEEKDFSQTAERVVKFMVVNHFSLHPIRYGDSKKIEYKLGIPAKELLISRYKES